MTESSGLECKNDALMKKGNIDKEYSQELRFTDSKKPAQLSRLFNIGAVGET